MACLLSSPTSTASTRARRRSRFSAETPYTAAIASAKNAVASRNTAVSPAAADSAAIVPSPGSTAVDPTAAPLAVTAAT